MNDVQKWRSSSGDFGVFPWEPFLSFHRWMLIFRPHRASHAGSGLWGSRHRADEGFTLAILASFKPKAKSSMCRYKCLETKIIMCITSLNKDNIFRLLSTLRTLKTLMKVSVYAHSHSTFLIMSHTSSTSQISRSRSFVDEMEGCKLASKRPAARSAIIALVHASKC